ncbi:hypothetical protein FGE12_27665 [Aggregicoccus sp. 17bor-14]|uniref:DUF6184 family natural product biosynthesis lipoprotein n=1 Tax=Myxococcaceae TaxID=31 RepID=UPI00129C42E5|nr:MULTISPECIES: DUF6184 family natural product biosynthesis lipoprotein [Myxococcaceae]MBF5046225.1 hypothetical protein [Simulacricoccus sp. 17bor-14]MRI91949.1 hypothetical protein [Aggregicoccus sp. 17bor-14]
MKRALTTLFTLSLLAGCGGGNLDQQDAREQATEHTCDRAEKCGQVGAGKTFVDRDDCEVKAEAFWNSRWPKEACDDHVKQDDLDLCLGAIDVTICGDGLGEFLTVANQCKPELVCAGS